MSVSVEVQVIGMTCAHCVSAVTEEVSGVAGVTGVEVDLAAGRVTITSESGFDIDKVEAAIAEAGYSLA